MTRREPFTCPHCGQAWQPPDETAAPDKVYALGIEALRGVARHFRAAHGDEELAATYDEELAEVLERRSELLEVIAARREDDDLVDAEVEPED